MTKKKWFLLVLVALIVFGYIKLFYKTYSKDVVAGSADCILLLDVKRITNTLIWNAITTPGQWKIGNIFSSRKKEPGLKDIVDIPDYIMAFHIKDQPVNAWYVVFTISDDEKFREVLEQYHFEKITENQYGLANSGIRIQRHGNQLLVGTAALKESRQFAQAAEELFVKKRFASDEMIHKAMDAKSHLAIQFNANSFLEKDGLLTANFDKEKISIDGRFTPQAKYISKEVKIGYNAASLYTLGFAQPTDSLYALISDSARQKISARINFNIDSFFIPTNTAYRLDLSGIRSRMDSAITYSYDDDFNKIESKVVNKVNEPAFDLMVTSDSAGNIYHYLQRNGLLEKSDTGELFTPIPFVRSYVQPRNKDQFIVRSANYNDIKNDQQITCLFFQRFFFGAMTSDTWKYVPDTISKALANIEYLNMQSTLKGKEVIFECTVQKKKNDLPIIKL